MSGAGELVREAAEARTVGELAAVLKKLRRGRENSRFGRALTYRELSAATGLPHTTIGTYLSGKVLAPADRFDLLIAALGADPGVSQALATARDRVEDLRLLGAPASGQRDGDQHGLLLDAIAQQSAQVAGIIAGGTGDDTLDWLSERIHQCAVAYARFSAAEIVPDLTELHHTALSLLSAPLSREQARRLYFCSGFSGYLLACASHDRTDWVTAGRQAEAAVVFAERAGDENLRALIHNIQSLSCLLRGKTADALGYASAGVAAVSASRGGMSVLLPLREARALAVLGRTTDASRLLSEVERRWDRMVPDAFDALLGYDGENVEQSYLSFFAEAFAALPPTKDVLSAAERHARSAVAAYPDPRDCTWTSDRAALSHLVLATAHAHQDRLDAVADAVEPVLALPRQKRVADLLHMAGKLSSVVLARGTRDLSRDRLLQALSTFTGGVSLATR